jgi:predicted GNAT family acetyltransferase
MNQYRVTDNKDRQRYELVENGHTAFADYSRQPARLVISHVEAPVPLRGTGAAGRLMEGVLAAARKDGLKVMPLCGYARAYILRHKEHKDLLG